MSYLASNLLLLFLYLSFLIFSLHIFLIFSYKYVQFGEYYLTNYFESIYAVVSLLFTPIPTFSYSLRTIYNFSSPSPTTLYDVAWVT